MDSYPPIDQQLAFLPVYAVHITCYNILQSSLINIYVISIMIQNDGEKPYKKFLFYVRVYMGEYVHEILSQLKKYLVQFLRENRKKTCSVWK